MTGRDETLPALATLPAGLRLAVTGAKAGGVERYRADALTGIILARAIGKTRIAGSVCQPPFAHIVWILTGCRGPDRQ
jgi:hypothetical protein